MPTVRESVEILAPQSVVFERSNDLERWPEIMSEYESVDIVYREGQKLTFRIDHKSGASWESSRFLFPELGIAIAERGTPRSPFRYMHIVWTYESVDPDRTTMTWIMDFELPSGNESETSSWIERLREHTILNMRAMKEDIERYYSSVSSL